MSVSVIVEQSARLRIKEYYRRASLRHNLLVSAAIRKVVDDAKGIAPLLPTAKSPSVGKWQRRNLMQITSQRVRWCYGIWVEHRDTQQVIHVEEAEHQDNMADEAFPLQEEQ